MFDAEFPAPQSGFVVTHFLVVSDQDRSRDFYHSVFGATVVLERDPLILKMANSWLILNVGGGPTDDKPTVTLGPNTRAAVATRLTAAAVTADLAGDRHRRREPRRRHPSERTAPAGGST